MRVLSDELDMIELETVRVVDGKPIAVIIAVPNQLADDDEIIEVEVRARLTELLRRQYGPGQLVRTGRGLTWRKT